MENYSATIVSPENLSLGLCSYHKMIALVWYKTSPRSKYSWKFESLLDSRMVDYRTFVWWFVSSVTKWNKKSAKINSRKFNLKFASHFTSRPKSKFQTTNWLILKKSRKLGSKSSLKSWTLKLRMNLDHFISFNWNGTKVWVKNIIKFKFFDF